tara:strand:- start:87 stop:257 length:171 start_codon:yes stop_codon:yes gene_type:complete
MRKNLNTRRQGALERLQASKFTPKTIKGKERSEEKWTEKKEEQIAILEKRVRHNDL